MKKWISGLLSLAMFMTGIGAAVAETSSEHKLLYQVHGSLRIVTREARSATLILTRGMDMIWPPI